MQGRETGRAVNQVKAAARELIRRMRCQLSLHSFALNITVPTAPEPALKPDEDLLGPASELMPVHLAAIYGVLQRAMNKPFGRFLIMAPPGSVKSLATVVACAWEMGRKPGSRIIYTSFSSEVAERQARRAMQIIRDEEYRLIWPNNPTLVRDAAGDFITSTGSNMLAMGLMAGLTSNRATGFIVDDPLAGREEADSELQRKRIRAAYFDDLLTRTLPGAWGGIIMCMVGDTQVRMADGTERKLKYLRKGDLVASYKEGGVVSARVVNWANQGEDSTFAIGMESGRITRANARHPFLIQRGDARVWVRLKDLKVGDLMVTASTPGLSALPKGARNRRIPKGSATATTTSGGGLLGSVRHLIIRGLAEMRAFVTATASALRNMSRCLSSKKESARYASNPLEIMSGLIGATSFALTTATTPGRSGGFCATTATSPSATEKQKRCCSPQPLMYEIQLDRITSISPDGREEVFDIQVEDTENFIADGVISHNTRWHEADLAADAVLPDDYDGSSGTFIGKDGLEWEVLCIPAKAEREDDPLGRKVGEYLWPQWWPVKHWQMYEHATGTDAARTWASLYQQRPTPQGSGRLDEKAIDYYKAGTHPPIMAFIGAGDYAVTAGKNDFTELGVFGVDTQGHLWEVDWWHEQSDVGKSTEQSIDMFIRWKAPMWFNEGGVIDKAMGPLFNLRMRERQMFTDRRALPSMSDKLAKCQAFIARCNAGVVHFRDNANSRRIVQQIASLPAGRYDDAADVCGLVGRALDQFPIVREHKPAPPPAEIKPFTEAWLKWKPPAPPARFY